MLGTCSRKFSPRRGSPITSRFGSFQRKPTKSPVPSERCNVAAVVSIVLIWAVAATATQNRAVARAINRMKNRMARTLSFFISEAALGVRRSSRSYRSRLRSNRQSVWPFPNRAKRVANQEHLAEIICSMMEEMLNAMLDTEADCCARPSATRQNCSASRTSSPFELAPPLSLHEACPGMNYELVWPFGPGRNRLHHLRTNSLQDCWPLESVALELHGSGNHLERFGLGNFSPDVLHAVCFTRSFHAELSGCAARTRTGVARDYADSGQRDPG